MAMKDMTITLRVRVPLDESMLDSAGWRCLWEEVDDLVEKGRGMGEITGLTIDGMPDSLVLVSPPEDTMRAHIRAAMREGGS